MTTYEHWSLLTASAAILLSLIALIISLLSVTTNSRANKATLPHEVKNSIDTAKTYVQTLTVQMAPLKAKHNKTEDETRQYNILLTVYESGIEKVLNAYEDGCQKYNANLILRDEFKESYFGDIQDYVEAFPEKFQGPLTRYTFMLKLFNQWHKPS